MNPNLGTAHGRVGVLGNQADYNQRLVLAMGVEYVTEVTEFNRTDKRLFFKAKDFKKSLPCSRKGTWNDSENFWINRTKAPKSTLKIASLPSITSVNHQKRVWAILVPE